MTDLLTIVPSFPTSHYTHLLPSLEKNLITTSDLLTLDGIEVAKRAQLPLLDVKRLIAHVLASLQSELGVETAQDAEGIPKRFADVPQKGEEGWGKLRTNGPTLNSKAWNTISLGNEKLDALLGGGIPTGYITELVGESGAAKTQFLLLLLLFTQLPPPHGLARPAIYISTEHALPTPRLMQLIATHPILAHLPPTSRPSLSRILSISTPDLESQDHILAFQLPVVVERHNIGLVVIDSVAANYRAERASSGAISGKGSRGEALADRGAHLVQLGAQLRKLAREHDVAVVVANQVSDRFSPLPASTDGARVPGTQRSGVRGPWSSSPPQPSQRGDGQPPPPPAVLSLDHQLRWFSGWGDMPEGDGPGENLKVPSLGLTWANQLDCRIALLKEASFARGAEGGEGREGREEWGKEGGKGVEWAPRRWRRHMRLVFAPWARPTGEGERGVEFKVWEGGVRAV